MVLKLKLLVNHDQWRGFKCVGSRVGQVPYPQLPEG